MTRDELEAKYKDHPLGWSIKACEDTGNLNLLHRYFIAALSVIHVLNFQGELSREQAQALEDYLNQIVDGRLDHPLETGLKGGKTDKKKVVH